LRFFLELSTAFVGIIADSLLIDILLIICRTRLSELTLKTEHQVSRSMSVKKFDLDAMSMDDLWSLHERISGILSTRIQAEKHELEKRLAILSRGLPGLADVSRSHGGRPRRRYPVVLPKYRNPQTSETWSGRGKRPRWLAAAMKSGHKIEEFRIRENNATGRQRA
jgi:DNA-binding protein H-NS